MVFKRVEMILNFCMRKRFIFCKLSLYIFLIGELTESWDKTLFASGVLELRGTFEIYLIM